MKKLLTICLAVLTFSAHAQLKWVNDSWKIRTTPTGTTYQDLRLVSSVNGKVGIINLTANDIGEVLNRRWMLDAEKSKLQSLIPYTFGPGFSVNSSTNQVTYVGTSGSGAGDMLKSVYDNDNDGIVDNALMVNGLPASQFVQKENGKALSSNDFTGAYRLALDQLATTYASLTQLGNYVLKEAGKVLSTNDFTAAYKQVLDAISQSYTSYTTVGGVFTSFRNFPGFGPNKVLTTDGSSNFSWVATSSFGSSTTTSPGSTTTTTPGSGTTATFASADSTINRSNRAQMTDLNVSTVQQLQSALSSDLTNRHIVLAGGVYESPNGFERTGSWTNVEVDGQNRAAILRSTASTVTLLFQGSKTVNRVKLNGIKFESTATGDGYPMVFTNELVSFAGLEFAFCEFTNPNNAANAFGIIQYSTSSNSGGTSTDLYMHDNYFHNVGRMGMEILSQGYDFTRLSNVTVTRNRFQDMGRNNEYGMGYSLSGLIRRIRCADNVANECKRVTYEYVNVQDVNSDNNSGTTTGKPTVGYGISDDAQHTTRNINITGGNFDVTQRPFYAYDTKDVHINGLNQLWKGHRGADCNIANASFTNMNLLIHSTEVEAAWQFGGSSNNVTVTNSTISSAGATAAGYQPSFEIVVLRSGTSYLTFTGNTTILGRRGDGTTYAEPGAGGNGQIVNQGSNNTLTNNTPSVAN